MAKCKRCGLVTDIGELTLSGTCPGVELLGCRERQIFALEAALVERERRIEELQGERDRFHDDYWSRVRECERLEAQLGSVRDELAWSTAAKLLPQRPQDGDEEET